MANKHILSLEVPTVANCEIFRVKDTSQYTDSLYVDCGELLITPPGFNQGNLIKVQPGFEIEAITQYLQQEYDLLVLAKNKLPSQQKVDEPLNYYEQN